MSQILKSKKIFFIALATIIFVGSAAYAYKSAQDDKQNGSNPEAGYTGPSEDQEKTEAEANKTNADKRAELEKEDSQTKTTTKKSVSVVITNAQVNSINSYVSGVFEDGGTCTATITKGSSQILKTSEGFKDATHTTCAPIFLKRSDFSSSGTWSVKVSYSSVTSEGQSQAVNIEVQ